MKRGLIIACLAGCQSGSWALVVEADSTVTPPREPACALAVDRLFVVVRERALLDEAGDATSESRVGWAVDVLEATPSPSLSVDRPRHAALRVAVGPPDARTQGTVDETMLNVLRDRGVGMRVAGRLDCGRIIRWTWDLPGPMTQRCTSTTLDVPRGPVTDIGWSVAPRALFADDLDAPLDAPPVLTAFNTADVDLDGDLTLEELAQVDLVPLGYRGGGESPPRDLAEWLAVRSERIGAFPEGWCRVGR